MNFIVDMLSLGMLNRVLDDLNGSIIITKNRRVKKRQTIIQQLVLHPNDLRAARGYIRVPTHLTSPLPLFLVHPSVDTVKN